MEKIRSLEINLAPQDFALQLSSTVYVPECRSLATGSALNPKSPDPLAL